MLNFVLNAEIKFKTNMKKLIKNWCNHCDLPEDATSEFITGYEKLTNNQDDALTFSSLLNEYDENMYCDFEVILEKTRELASKTNVNEFTAIALLFVCMMPSLKKYYEKAGYPIEVYNESIKDVSFQARTCKKIYGVWGTATTWHTQFYRLEILGFGRLQFQPQKAYFDYHENGFDIVKGETQMINVHIPETGAPLDYDACSLAFEKGAKFFRDKLFNGEKVLFHCRSWLLWPKHKEILSPASNMVKFIDRYNIVNSGLYDHYNELKLLFGVIYDGNPDNLPSDNSLRRKYIEILKRGEKTGWGQGVLYK